MTDVPVPSPLAATVALNLIYKVPLVNDTEFCGKVTNPLPPLSVPLVPGSPVVEYAMVKVTAPALVWSFAIAVFPLPFANCIVLTPPVINVSPNEPANVSSPGAVVHFVVG